MEFDFISAAESSGFVLGTEGAVALNPRKLTRPWQPRGKEGKGLVNTPCRRKRLMMDRKGRVDVGGASN